MFCFVDFDDDLLDLLSDSGDEDLAPKKREKPKIQLKSKSKPVESAPTPINDVTQEDNGKPITFSSNINISSKEELDRPRTSRGKQSLTDDNVSSEPASLPSAPPKGKKNPSGADVLTMDFPSKQNAPAGSLNSTQIDFGDEDDDLLTGLGLDDEDSSVIGSAKLGKKPERRGSMLDELLGKSSSSAKAAKIKLKEHRDEDKQDSDAEGEGFQFGGYLPTVASESTAAATTVNNKPRLKVPSGRRNSSELSDSLTSRPGSAPSPVKKSVRFVDTIETSERPSSSPASSEVSKPPPGSRGARRPTATAATSDQVTPQQHTGDGAKKPPLPRRSNTNSSGKSKESAGDMETTGSRAEEEEKPNLEQGDGSKENKTATENQSITDGSDR